jgi:RimJ/RimL family protein N-acetyltransferase
MPELGFPDPPLADEAVLLRPWAQLDVPSLLLGRAGETADQFSWPSESRYTKTDARRFFVEQEQARERGEELHFAFVDPLSPDAVLGGGSLYGVDRLHGRAAVGYWLLPQARGHGIATRATVLLARYAFDILGVARLELTCGPENEASQRVAGRCGFVREGLLRSHIPYQGQRRDTVMFSLLPGELQTP